MLFQGDQVFKSVFIIFFQGDQLKTRVKKICEGFRATLYPCPEAPADRREMAMGVMTRIEDLNTVSYFLFFLIIKIYQSQRDIYENIVYDLAIYLDYNR